MKHKNNHYRTATQLELFEHFEKIKNHKLIPYKKRYIKKIKHKFKLDDKVMYKKQKNCALSGRKGVVIKRWAGHKNIFYKIKFRDRIDIIEERDLLNIL